MYKKLYIFISLLICFSNGHSQNPFVEINNTGSIAQTWLLFRTYREDHKVELTYLASELINNNINLGDTIFSIGFEIFDRANLDFEYQVMYDAEINITENSITKTVWTGNLAPTEGMWYDIMFDSTYIRSSGNDLTVEFCFNNCEFNGNSFYVNYGSIGADFYSSSSNGYSYASSNSECSSNPSIIQKRPNTRFGLSNSITNQNISVCGSGSNVVLTANSFSTIPNSFNYFNHNSAWTYTNSQGITSKYYRIQSGRKRNWLEADHHCQSLGGNLVHIENQAENNIVDLIPTTDPNGNGRNWIGGFQNCNNQSFSNPNNGWEWSNGDLINNTSYSNWANNEPNNSNEEYAIEILNNGTWNDEDIKGDDRRYIMEIQDKYVWSTGDVTSSPTIIVNPSSTTLYWVDRIQSNGIQREYFTVFVKQSPTLTINNPIPSNIVCSGDTISVSVNSNIATSYLWENNLSSFTSANSSQYFIISDTSKVVVTAQASNGCTTKDSLFLYSYPKLEININVIDSICDSSYAFIRPFSSSLSNLYCQSIPADDRFCNIYNVVLNGDNYNLANNTTGNNATYSNFTNLSTDVTAGQTYNISIQLGTTGINYGGKLFIDWDCDGDFDDVDEHVATLPFNSVNYTHNINFTVPSFAINDSTRMRIVSQFIASADTSMIGSCDVGSQSVPPFTTPYFGETEDYTIFINSSNSPSYNYNWSNGITDTIIYNLNSGTYSVIYTDQNGCLSHDSAYVGESAYISVSADSNQTICNDGQPSNLISQLDSSSSMFLSTIQWQPDTFFIDATVANPQFTNGLSLLTNTLFTVTYNNGTCTSTDTVRVNVRPRPIVSNIVVGPLPACENDTLSITAVYMSPNISEYRFQQKTQSNNNWTNINTVGNGWGSSNPIIFGPIIETTEFRVKIREESGCKPSSWGGPTNQGAIVPINNMNNLLIYHN